ncbi:MAG TPA: DUF72 domain-containing protein [Candidatus Dormibacteraeota bacterium]|nr:DUF72 domain-containing protein [Candidatus Dormibacteraeota bacterium]
MADRQHDPGWEEAAERAAEVAGAGAGPVRVPGGGEVRVGTASWTDPTMTAPGVFYPPEAQSAEDRLRYYASRFPVVEVDATYYGLPQEQVSKRWAERTPDGFVFHVKAHALMTGQPTETRRLPKALREELPADLRDKPRVYADRLPSDLVDEVWAAFRRGIEPLRASGRLGAVLLQFPRWVFPSHETREHIRAARSRLGGLPVSVEFRHGSWFNEKNAERTLRFLTDEAIPYVMVDEPQGFKSSVPPVVAVTSPKLAIVRFHGRNAQTWEQRNLTPAERFRYLYDEDELADWVPRVMAVARGTERTDLVFNNCSANYGTTNASEIASLLLQQTG